MGALLVFFGVIVLLATFARPLAGALAAPLRVFGVTGVLARGNATRNPRRTAATASALVIGLALVGLVAIFGQSAKSSVRAAVDRGIRADYVLKAQQFAGFSPQVAQRLREQPELAAVAAFRFGNVRVEGEEETVTGVDPTQLGPVTDLRLTSGSIDRMGDAGVLVQADAAARYGLQVGDPVLDPVPTRVRIGEGGGDLRAVRLHRRVPGRLGGLDAGLRRRASGSTIRTRSST